MAQLKYYYLCKVEQLRKKKEKDAQASQAETSLNPTFPNKALSAAFQWTPDTVQWSTL